MKQTYTRLSELQPTSEQIAWNINHALPDYAPLDAVGLNVGAVQRLAHAAGFYANITVTTPDRLPQSSRSEPAETKKDKESNLSITITGVNSDGTVTGGIGRTTKPPISNQSGFSRQGGYAPGTDNSIPLLKQMAGIQANRRQLIIGVDPTYVEETLAEQRKLRDPAAWAKVVGGVVKKQIVGAANRTMFEQSFGLIGAVGGASLVRPLAELIDPTTMPPVGLITGGTMLSLCAISGINHIKTRQNPDVSTGYLPFYLDRFAAVRMRALGASVAKAL